MSVRMKACGISEMDKERGGMDDMRGGMCDLRL